MSRETQVHPGKECGPCSLCKHKLPSYAHPFTWSQPLYDNLKGGENTVNKDSCICHPCEQDFKNGATKDNYVPRWKRRKQKYQKCIIANCSAQKNFINTTICTSEDVAQLYDINHTMESTGSKSSISTLVLCTEHYKSMHMYMQLNDSMYVSKIRFKTCHLNIKLLHQDTANMHLTSMPITKH